MLYKPELLSSNTGAYFKKVPATMVPPVILALERKTQLVHLGSSSQMIQLNSHSRSREDLISKEVKVFLRCYLRLCYCLQAFTCSFISHQHTQSQHTQTHAYTPTQTILTHPYTHMYTHLEKIN